MLAHVMSWASPHHLTNVISLSRQSSTRHFAFNPQLASETAAFSEMRRLAVRAITALYRHRHFLARSRFHGGHWLNL